MTARQVFDQSLRVTRVLYAALVMTTVMLAVVSFVVQPNVPQPIAPMMAINLGAVAVVVAALSFFLPAKTTATATARIRVE
ncbi:MAG TPA: hypothetical protein VF765_23645, partial [Polyangiaceae bacterium]